MKYIRTGLVPPTCVAWLLIAAATPVGAQTPESAPSGTAPTAPTSDEIGYLFGLSFGEQMHNAGITNQLTVEALARGLKDGLDGRKTSPGDRQHVQEFIKSVVEAAVARNEAAAKDFLAQNGKEKGVTTTASGLQYKVLLPGNAKAAAITPTDSVTVQYRGKLIDGSEFDSTYEKGQPAPFTVNRVIPGWQEALLLMKPGAKWRIFIPPDLGYGKNPKPGIPGGSLLIFDVELMSARSNGPTPQPPATPIRPSVPQSQ
jgi:FKBP-type peptidyl-prolyl cis-trans isomerase